MFNGGRLDPFQFFLIKSENILFGKVTKGDKNLIPSNPADRIIISKPEPFKGDYYLDSEVLNLFEVIKGHKIDLVVLLTAFSACAAVRLSVLNGVPLPCPS